MRNSTACFVLRVCHKDFEFSNIQSGERSPPGFLHVKMHVEGKDFLPWFWLNFILFGWAWNRECCWKLEPSAVYIMYLKVETGFGVSQSCHCKNQLGICPDIASWFDWSEHRLGPDEQSMSKSRFPPMPDVFSVSLSYLYCSHLSESNTELLSSITQGMQAVGLFMLMEFGNSSCHTVMTPLENQYSWLISCN